MQHQRGACLVYAVVMRYVGMAVAKACTASLALTILQGHQRPYQCTRGDQRCLHDSATLSFLAGHHAGVVVVLNAPALTATSPCSSTCTERRCLGKHMLFMLCYMQSCLASLIFEGLACKMCLETATIGCAYMTHSAGAEM